MQAIPKKCKVSALLHSWVFFYKKYDDQLCEKNK